VDETHDVKTFVLAPNRRWAGHRAGQFVTVEVEVDGVRTVRCYSLSSASSASGGAHVSITVKRVGGGRVSSWLHDNLKRGDVLRLGGPAGEFVLPESPPRKLLLLSGGSGITPVMSILRDLSARGAVHDVVFIHAARSARDVIFGVQIDELARRHPGLRVVIVREDASGSLGGRLDAAKLVAIVPDLAVRETYLCGPPGMMAALSPIWTDANIAHRLKIERFVPASGIAPLTSGVAPPEGSRPAKFELSLVRSGRNVSVNGSGTLLEELERAGERPVYGCRLGICNTCRCRKRSGVVEDIVTGAVSTGADEDIRLCTSLARTDLELVV
jgi:ferredoxin-NADP reductase